MKTSQTFDVILTCYEKVMYMQSEKIGMDGWCVFLIFSKMFSCHCDSVSLIKTVGEK
jgi:hypothetical protein